MSPDEPSRLAALDALGLMEEEQDERLQRVVRLAKSLFDVPTVAVNLVDRDRLWAAASEGLAEREIPRKDTFCSVAIEGEGQLVVPDAARDRRFADAPFVTGEGGIRFYAGQPLKFAGERVGTLCLMADQPRELSAEESRALRDLGSWLEQEMAYDATQHEAREVQRRLLPGRRPEVAEFDLAARCLPARDVGGDFYDWSVDDAALHLLLADVMGKGLSAAVVAAGLRAVLRSRRRTTADLGEAVTWAATGMEEDLEESGRFVTLVAAQLDRATGAVCYVDAGHGAAMVLSPTGVRRLPSDDLPIGVLPGDRWTAREEQLAPGETLVLASDGVIDAYDSPEEAYADLDRLARTGADPTTLVDRLCDRAGYGQPDDLTVVAARRRSS